MSRIALFTRLFTTLTLVVATATVARGVTISVAGDINDYGIYYTSPGPPTAKIGDEIHRLGLEAVPGTPNVNVVHVFKLPVLGGGTLVGADYSFFFASRDGSPNFSADVWGIGFQTSTSPLLEYYVGDGPTSDGFVGNVKLQNNILTSSTSPGVVQTDATGDSNLLTYLNGFYAANPTYAGGTYVFLRLNHELTTNISDGYVVAMQEDSRADPTLVLDVAAIPEPSTLLLATLVLVPFAWRLRARCSRAHFARPCLTGNEHGATNGNNRGIIETVSEAVHRPSLFTSTLERHTRRHISIGAVLTAVSLASPAAANVNVYDGFSYPAASNLQGASGGIGFSGAWTNSVAVINSGSLSYGSLATSGNSVIDSAASAVFNNRTLASPLGAAGTTRYFSFLLQSPSPGPVPENKSYGLGLLGSNGDLFIGKADALPATTQYVLENFEGAGQVSSGVTAVAGVTDFLVVRADFAAGNDTFRLYVNPLVGGTEPVTANAVKSDHDFGTIDRVQINGDAMFLFDELRFGTTYADVTPVPEPSTLILAVLALVPFARRLRGVNQRPAGPRPLGGCAAVRRFGTRSHVKAGIRLGVFLCPR